jgi:SAM-dependent methyltransferase
VSVGDERVARIARLVCDLAGGSPQGLRILDLACDQGNFAIQLAQLGAAEVVGVEARDHVKDAIARRDSLGLKNASFEQGDVRAITSDSHGMFDVVLCLGILYHLDVPDVFQFAGNVARLTNRFAIIETQIGLSRRRKASYEGRDYWGKSYLEDVSMPGASIDNPESFMPTRASLLNLLQSVGFSTVAEVQIPVIPVLDAWRDHVVLIAVKGAPQSFDPPESAVWPERLPPMAHPTQGLRWRVNERLQRLRGGGLPAIFRGPPAP